MELLFKAIVQDYREAFKGSAIPKRDQEIFLRGQISDFLHRSLRRIVPRSCLPDEWDRDALRSHDSAAAELLSIPDFMQKTEFRTKALKVARSKIDVEHERGKKTKSDAVVKTVMGESFNFFIDQGRKSIKNVAKELLMHLPSKSDITIGPACFDYAVLLKLPMIVVVECYQNVFQSCSSRAGLQESFKTSTWTTMWSL